MLAVEKPKQPKVIKYVWWDGFNKEEVNKVFPTVGFGKRTVYDEDPCEVVIHLNGNRVRYIKGDIYLCCGLGDDDTKIFTLSKKSI